MQIDLIERRHRHPYLGARRFEYVRGERRRRDPRAFAAPAGALHWTRADQARAIDQGFFLQRVLGDERVQVLPLQNGRWRNDAEVMAWLEAECFRRDAHAMKAVHFIEQQDRYGYTGVWEKAQRSRNRSGGAEFWTKGLRWYKDLKAEQRKARNNRPSSFDIIF